MSTFTSEPTVKDAVRRAAHARRADGKRYDHQRRLSPSVLREAAARLEQVDIATSRDFDELHRLIETTIGPIHGIGELMVYDTALRIGAKLGLAPECVYLHAGTRQGARALGLNWRKPYLSVAECPEELHTLEPREIEDCLCIYNDDLKMIGTSHR